MVKPIPPSRTSFSIGLAPNKSKVSLKNFDYIIAPEHDGLSGENVINSKGALHYLSLKEIKDNHGYLLNNINRDKKQLLLVLGGPNKYYSYDRNNLEKIFINFLIINYFFIALKDSSKASIVLSISSSL